MYFVSFGHLDCPLLSHFPLVCQIPLVSHHVHSDIFSGMLFDFRQPLRQVDKRVLSGDIICKKYAVSATVEYAGDGLE